PRVSVFSCRTATRAGNCASVSRVFWQGRCNLRAQRTRSSLRFPAGREAPEESLFWEKPFENALTSLRRHVHATVRLVLWDGREFDCSDKPRVTVRLKGARAASALVRPSLLTLAEAYIDGDAEIEGDVREAIRSAEALTRAIPRPLFQSEGPTNGR